MFHISSGKGFFISFPNGYKVSVQFGYDNYCTNRWIKGFDTDNWAEEERKLGEKGSNTAEIAIKDSEGKYVGKELGIFTTDTVEGWADATRVLEVLNLVAALP
jgi:hypothetical protein